MSWPRRRTQPPRQPGLATRTATSQTLAMIDRTSLARAIYRAAAPRKARRRARAARDGAYQPVPG